MAFCIKCGADNPAEAGFCHKCGQPIYKQNTKPVAIPEPPVVAAKNIAKSQDEKPLTVLIIVNLLLYCSIDFALTFVLPVFRAMYSDFGAKLPMPTQLLFGLSNFFRNWWWCLQPVLVLVVVVFVIQSAQQITPRKWWRRAAILQFLMFVTMVACLFLPIFQLGAVAGGLQ
ncbi:MAG TPA: zinc-ribbon domain-containing protein [Lacunisphaera sp.]|nr:zinc-ribbon domain-containing protein [Lacunisphaera sp.]